MPVNHQYFDDQHYGMSTTEIARVEGISPRKVQTIISQALRKLGRRQMNELLELSSMAEALRENAGHDSHRVVLGCR
jgi:DNA-binding NarL/FixJ family response regulator